MPIELNLEVCRTALSSRKITQTALAKAVDINRQSMCRIFAGKQRPSEKLVRKMAEVLGVELEQIVEVADGMYVLTEIESTLLKLFRKLPMVEKAALLTAANETLTALESESGGGSFPASSIG